MSTRSKRRATTKYTRYTPVQLCSTISKLQQNWVTVSQWPTWRKVQGVTVAQYRTAIQREIKTVARVLRTKTVQQVTAKIKTLKTQIARRNGVRVSSPKATSSAIKRLTAKLRQIRKATKVSVVVKVCSTVHVSKYKNPKNRTTTPRVATTPTTKVSTKYRRQAKTLKREIRSLKRRNSFMRRLVGKFRRQVSRMQSHYGTLRNKPRRLKVIQGSRVGQEVSNIVRFSNALGNALTKQRTVG